MRSYIRYQKTPERRIPAQRYALIRAKIGYLYRADGKILHAVQSLDDPTCRDGAMLRISSDSFLDVYYGIFMPQIHNDVDGECTAVYFDPYMGKFLIIGSKQLYFDAKRIIGNVGSVTFLEDESPFRFDPISYGAYEDVSAGGLAYEEYFTPDVTGTTVAACMVRSIWDDKTQPWRCAMEFFDRYYDRLLSDAADGGEDMLLLLLCAIVREGNHALLTRLFTLIPQTLARFRPILREERKFLQAKISLPEVRETQLDAPVVFNLFQYTMLCGNPDMMETVFRFYEHSAELSEMLRHPMFYHLGFYHMRCGNYAALAILLKHEFSPNCTESKEDRLTLLSLSCICHCPAMTALLVSYGADVDKKDNSGRSAIDYAAESSDASCLAALLAEDTPQLKSRIAALAENLPLRDDNQAVLCVLRAYIDRRIDG